MALAAGALTLVVLGAAEVFLRRTFDAPGLLPPVLVPALVALGVAVPAWFWATMRYRSWRFELTDSWIQARWGVINRYCATVPRNRVQTLTSHNGPLDRLLGLTSVTVHTAGAGAPNLAIPHLEDRTVEWLRGELARGPLD
jgi:uncharacterized protein